MNEKANEAKNAYRRRWAKANRDKIRAMQERYWTKVAEREAAAAQDQSAGAASEHGASVPSPSTE